MLRKIATRGWYRPLQYRNENYLIVPGEQEFIQQGYIFIVGEFYETLAGALDMNGINVRSKQLRLLSPTPCLDTLNQELNVKFRVFEITSDIQWGSIVWLSEPVLRSSDKTEIYIGKYGRILFVINPWINHEEAAWYNNLFAIHRLILN